MFMLLCGTIALFTMVLIIGFTFMNRKLKTFKRSSALAYVLSLLFPGSGLAFAGTYVWSWMYLILLGAGAPYLIVYASMNDNTGIGGIAIIGFIVLFFVQANQSSTAAKRFEKKARTSFYEKRTLETNSIYTENIQTYINQGYHLALDTNFIMHFQPILLNVLQETKAHIFLHPTVFGELEGLKKNESPAVRRNAQMGFDVLEYYQKSNRLQWTRRPKNHNSYNTPDERIVAGVLHEIQLGTPLVFVSHDKGARIMARSLNIPVIDSINKIAK
ncbi:PIN domain-containing protein [Jeotgalibacillus malaysiensis]|uniref:PIN domain-containing protein n=1 Tax=Jeotgalibacillus malaysiensis TaxID=1508404 RepID=UPI00384F9A70